MQEEIVEWKRLIYRGVDYGDWYLISNIGQVKNVKNGYILKQRINSSGYYSVGVSCDIKRNFIIHKAFMETFVPNPNNYPFVNHIDGNKLNNRIDNLEWCTNKMNMIHAVKTGLQQIMYGVDTSRAKLTAEDIIYIRNNYIPWDNEFGRKALAEKFDVCDKTIYKVLHNITYNNIK